MENYSRFFSIIGYVDNSDVEKMVEVENTYRYTSLLVAKDGTHPISHTKFWHCLNLMTFEICLKSPLTTHQRSWEKIKEQLKSLSKVELEAIATSSPNIINLLPATELAYMPAKDEDVIDYLAHLWLSENSDLVEIFVEVSMYKPLCF